MDPKYNHRHLPTIPSTRSEPRQPLRHDRPLYKIIDPSPHDGLDNETLDEAAQEQEIPLSELNAFCFYCLEQLTLAKQTRPARQIIATAITQKLSTYTRLKREMREAFEQQHAHHAWAKQLCQTIEPLLKEPTDAHEEQQNLGEFATRCVERDLQLHYRAKQLRERVTCLEQAVSRHLLCIGQDIGLPEKPLQKFVKKLKDIMEHHSA